MAAQSAAILFLGFMSLGDSYKNQFYRIVIVFTGLDSERKLKRCLG